MMQWSAITTIEIVSETNKNYFYQVYQYKILSTVVVTISVIVKNVLKQIFDLFSSALELTYSNFFILLGDVEQPANLPFPDVITRDANRQTRHGKFQV